MYTNSSEITEEGPLQKKTEQKEDDKEEESPPSEKKNPTNKLLLQGYIHGKEVDYLIDCGASRNFIATELVNQYG